MNLRGGCACGATRYKIKDYPLFTQACHCKNCKISTGSSFVIHTMIFEDDFMLNGKVSSTELPQVVEKVIEHFFVSIVECIYIVNMKLLSED